MTCKEALAARYRVLGKKANGYSEYAACLSFYEALRFYNSLEKRGFSVKAMPL
tara:strand:- start:5978 stop:6136 length:159 start_codon:yes stop_codon:yes gene_type:complete